MNDAGRGVLKNSHKFIVRKIVHDGVVSRCSKLNQQNVQTKGDASSVNSTETSFNLRTKLFVMDLCRDLSSFRQ